MVKLNEATEVEARNTARLSMVKKISAGRMLKQNEAKEMAEDGA